MPEQPLDAFDLLVCPLCADPLTPDGRAVRCAGGHAFDLAKQGYVNLLPGDARPGTADTARMVAARADFLAAGHYAPLASAVADAVPDGTARVLDAGAGTGYYLAAVLDAVPGAVGLALDLSKFALRRAARAHGRARAAVWDVWRPLPVASGAVDVVVNVFAPRNAAEFHRVLRGDGTLLVVTPEPDHLAELRAAHPGMLDVDAAKADRLAESLTGTGLFRRTSTLPLSYPLTLTPAEAAQAVAMGPSAHHTAPAFPHPLTVTASFRVSAYRRA